MSGPGFRGLPEVTGVTKWVRFVSAIFVDGPVTFSGFVNAIISARVVSLVAGVSTITDRAIFAIFLFLITFVFLSLSVVLSISAVIFIFRPHAVFRPPYDAIFLVIFPIPSISFFPTTASSSLRAQD